MAADHPPPGSPVEEIETPCLVLDLDVLETNARRMSEICAASGVAWRPHAKCHKSTAIARLVLDAGAIGVTCAKLGEAEVMAAAGVCDLLIANPLVGARRLERLAGLRRIADPIAVVDHRDHVEALSAAMRDAGVTLRVLVEVDVGMERCGVAPGGPALDLARLVAGAPALELAGIMGYEGHLLTIPDRAEKERAIAEAMVLLETTRSLLEREGLPCPIVSAGGTGSFEITVRQRGVTEVQAGGDIFMDRMYRELCGVTSLDYALTVHATVTGRPAPDRAIIDAGRKTLNQEIHMPAVRGRDDLTVRSLSAEHGILDVTRPPGPRIGERLELIPGYCDFTTVLHDRFHCVREGRLEAVWPLEGRGKLV